LDKSLINRSSFNFHRLEDLIVGTKALIPPFRQSDFLMLFVKTGAGKRFIEHCRFPVGDSSLAVIPKRVINAASYTSRPIGYLISFNPDFSCGRLFLTNC
jgi:hypothetical protein